MRQPIKAVALGVLMTIACLVVVGMSCDRPAHVPMDLPLEGGQWECRLVVGTSWSDTQVFFCHDRAAGECFWVPGRQGGTPVPTKCARHIFEEVRP